MGERQKNGSSGRSLDDVPTLLAKVGEDVVSLVESKLSLLKVEIKEELITYLRGGLGCAVGGVIAGVGFLLFNVALALLLAETLAPTSLAAPVRPALGFLVLGAAYLAVGLGLVKRAARRSVLVP